MAITHKYTIICDEVRREDNGKLIVLGMYVGVLTVPQIPFTLPSLTFFHLLESDRPGQYGMTGKLQVLETGRTIVEFRGGFGLLQPSPVVIPLRLGNVLLQEVGAYQFILEIEGEREPIITQFSVILQPPQNRLPFGGAIR
jgi:hypothetical protein